MSNYPWVKFYPSDWLAGTRGMSAAETGVYITLIMMMYERGEPVPDDRKRLARLCGTSPSSFSKIVDALIENGKVTKSDAGLWNERVEKEQKNRRQLSEVAKNKANARWGKEKEKQCNDDAAAMPQQCLPETRYQIPEEEKQQPLFEGEPPGATGPTFDELWKSYPHPSNRGPRPTEKFAKLSEGEKTKFRAAIPILRRKLTADHAGGFKRSAPMFSTYLNQKRWETELEGEASTEKRENPYAWAM